MIDQPKEMAVLHQCKLTLVVARGQGHNPIRATGVVLAHIEHICSQTVPTTAQLWDLSVRQMNATPWAELTRLAERERKEVLAFFREHALGDDELAR